MIHQVKYYRAIVSVAFAVILSLSGTAVFGQTHSDLNRTFSFAGLSTWNFANEKVNARDTIGPNEIWDGYIRDDLTAGLAKIGFNHSDDRPDLIVRYRLGTKVKQDVHVVHDNWGYGYHRGRWAYWHGGRGWGTKTVFRTPYDQSTLVLDVIDARTGELVWRGYDRRKVDDRSEKSVKRSVEKLMGRFSKDVRESRKLKS
jgi:hypothetical protein